MQTLAGCDCPLTIKGEEPADETTIVQTQDALFSRRNERTDSSCLLHARVEACQLLKVTRARRRAPRLDGSLMTSPTGNPLLKEIGHVSHLPLTTCAML